MGAAESMYPVSNARPTGGKAGLARCAWLIRPLLLWAYRWHAAGRGDCGVEMPYVHCNPEQLAIVRRPKCVLMALQYTASVSFLPFKPTDNDPFNKAYQPPAFIVFGGSVRGHG